MSRLEKRLCIFALVFVAIYVAALAASIGSRVEVQEKTVPDIRSAAPAAEEAHLVLAELLLPMLIVLAATVGFMAARRRKMRRHADPEGERENVFSDGG